MLKQRLQGFIAGVLITVLLVGTLALAMPQIREVFYGVNVIVNGVPQDFDDDMLPFIMDGRTFLPVRGIAEALGVDVNWDDSTNTVYIGDMPEIASVQTIQPGYLIMATNAAFPPFQFRSNAPTSVDGVDGICVAIAQIIANELGKTLRVVDMEFGAIILSVINNEVDIGMSGMTITAERAQSVNFSIPYYTDTQVIITNIDSEIQTTADLAEARVGVVINYTGDFIAEEMYWNGEIAEVVRTTSGLDAVLMLADGSVDAVFLDRITAKMLVEQYPNLTTIEDDTLFRAENYGVAINQENIELLTRINTILERLIEEGIIDGIVINYTLRWFT